VRGPLGFKESDVVRAIKSVLKAGLAIARLEIDPQSGRIVIITGGKPEETDTSNPWDKALGNEDQ
jgi:hypothetical protein